MTTVVMQRIEDDVIIGWDSAMTRGNEITPIKQPKVFAAGGVIYAIAGSLVNLNKLRYAANEDGLPVYDGEDAHWFAQNKLSPAVRRILGSDEDDEDGGGLGLLAVVDFEVFMFDSAMGFYASQDGNYSMGSGGDYALGALYAGASVPDALRAAVRIDPFSAGPLTVTQASIMVDDGE